MPEKPRYIQGQTVRLLAGDYKDREGYVLKVEKTDRGYYYTVKLNREEPSCIVYAYQNTLESDEISPNEVQAEATEQEWAEAQEMTDSMLKNMGLTRETMRPEFQQVLDTVSLMKIRHPDISPEVFKYDPETGEEIPLNSPEDIDKALDVIAERLKKQKPIDGEKFDE